VASYWAFSELGHKIIGLKCVDRLFSGFLGSNLIGLKCVDRLFSGFLGSRFFVPKPTRNSKSWSSVFLSQVSCEPHHLKFFMILRQLVGKDMRNKAFNKLIFVQ
jgi:hypothetical protein